MSKVETRSGWHCLAEGCFEHGEGPNSDRIAERHVKAFRHGTVVWTRPVEVSSGTEADSPVVGS
jgi:hypothetical protein